MRLYLSGKLMVLNADIGVFHHHAPRGGLRTTRPASSPTPAAARGLTHRQLPSVSECYLAQRYFTLRQVREMLWQSARGPSASAAGG